VTTLPFGLSGARLFAAGVMLAISILIYFRVERSKRFFIGPLFAVFTFQFVFFRLEPRPSLIATLFSMLLIPLLEKKRILTLVVFFVVWINFHAEALIGLALASLYFAVQAWEEQKKWPLALALGMPLIGFLQPLGPSLFTAVFRDTIESKTRIYEWIPTISALVRIADWKTLLLLALLAGWIIWTMFRREIPKREKAVAAAGFALSLFAIREIAWMVIPLVVLAKYAPDLGRIRAAALGLTILLFPWKHLSVEAWTTDVDPSRFPTEQVDFIERKGLTGNLFNFYDNGGYLIYRLFPRCRVFIDSRHAPYPEEIHQAHTIILSGGPEAESLLEKYGVDLLLIRSSYFADPDRNPAWFRAFTDGHYDVYIRKNERNAKNIERAEKVPASF
jgi:hypothetical protein